MQQPPELEQQSMHSHQSDEAHAIAVLRTRHMQQPPELEQQSRPMCAQPCMHPFEVLHMADIRGGNNTTILQYAWCMYTVPTSPGHLSCCEWAVLALFVVHCNDPNGAVHGDGKLKHPWCVTRGSGHTVSRRSGRARQ
jgi:hypothetical protein